MLHTTSLCPSSGYLSIPLPEGDKPVDSVFVREYEDIFVKVKQWGAFEEFDVVGDEIHMCSEVGAPVPDVVTDLERELDSRPGLALDVCCFLDHSFDAEGSM